MDPKKQAELFYKSLAATDAISCKLLARGARFQRGRVAALNRRIDDLNANNGSQDEIDRLTAEANQRTKLSDTFDALDGVIDKAIADRAVLDKGKFK